MRISFIYCLLTTQKSACAAIQHRVYCTHRQQHKDVAMRSIDQLANEICTLAGHINAANHRLLVLIAEFDRRKGWSASGAQSCAHWLNWKCGIAMGAAREKVRVARTLEEAAQDLRRHGQRHAQLLQGPRDHTRRQRRERGVFADDCRARHRGACGEPRARVSPLPGGRGIIARAAAAAEPPGQFSL